MVVVEVNGYSLEQSNSFLNHIKRYTDGGKSSIGKNVRTILSLFSEYFSPY